MPVAIINDFLKQVHDEILGKKIESSLNPRQQMIKREGQNIQRKIEHGAYER